MSNGLHPLKKARQELGYSQKMLADFVRISAPTIKRAEAGKPLRPDMIQLICDYFSSRYQRQVEPKELGLVIAEDQDPIEEIDSNNQALSLHRAPALPANSLSQQTRAIDTILLTHGSASPSASSSIDNPPFSVYAQDEQENQLGAWLTLGAGNLAPLFDAGLSQEDILQSLQIVLKVVQAMPRISRQQFMRSLVGVGVAAIVGSVPDFSAEKHISAQDRTTLHQAWSESIIAGWNLFASANMTLVLATGHSQLQLLHQTHSELYPNIRPLFYSPVYRLIGAAFFYQARYNDAMHAHKKAYITAVEAYDSWNMAESLGWQAGVLKACGRHNESIQAMKAALNLLHDHHDSQSLISQSRLLAQCAESAALLGDKKTMEETLDGSFILLDRFEGNDEFDPAMWQLYKGTCALYIHDFTTAETYLQQAHTNLKPHLTHQHASTALLLSQARLGRGDVERSVEAARTAVPYVAAADSPLVYRGLIDHVQKLTVQFPGEVVTQHLAEEVQQHPQLQPLKLYADGPRYLEATL